MRPLKEVILLQLLAHIFITAVSMSPDLSTPLYPDPYREYKTQVRSWTGSSKKRTGEEIGIGGELTHSALKEDKYTNGDWSIPKSDEAEEGTRYNGNEAPWAMQISASESELHGIFSRERMRWMPSHRRFRPLNQPKLSESEVPIQVHQLKQQQQRKNRPGLRPGTQLENLGGGVLADETEDEDDVEEEETVPYYPLPRKPPAQRRPQDTTGSKHSSLADLKTILKASGPLSLSEVLQRKNLSLQELLVGSRNALSAITSVSSEEEKPHYRRERPVFAVRPQITRRRPTTSTTHAPQEESQTTTKAADENVEIYNVILTSTPSPADASYTEDPSHDIFEIIWQDGGDGPTLAEVLSSRNMTVEDLIKQRQRAADKAGDITSLFGEVKEKDDEKKGSDIKGEEARNFAHFDRLEADWDQTYEEEPEERSSEEADQELTQSRNIYQVVTTAEGAAQSKMTQQANDQENNTLLSKSILNTVNNGPVKHEHETQTTPTHSQSHALDDNSSYSDNRKSSLQTHVTEPIIAHPQPFENFPLSDEKRPLVRSRLTSPPPREDIHNKKSEVLQNFKASRIPNFVDADLDYDEENSPSKVGLPMGVTSAIIASSALLGIALLIFLTIFVVFRYRQWRRRGGIGPHFCTAVLEAAAGSKNPQKAPKIVKKESAKDSWCDSIDSAQARLWRTLRRGRCRFYEQEREQM